MQNQIMTERAMERAISVLLRTGVIVSAVLVLSGGAVYLAAAHGPMQDYSRFGLPPEPLMHPVGIANLALHGNSRGIIQLGLLVLIATPVVRVGLALVAFGIRRDWLYVAVSAIVLTILALGFLIVR